MVVPRTGFLGAPSVVWQMIRCGHCKMLKPASEFYGQRAWCRECKKLDERKRRANPAVQARFRERYESDTEMRAGYMLARAKKRAAVCGVACTLTKEWIKAALDRGTCELTGLLFDLKASSRDARNPYCPALDRRVAGGDYSEENCRVVLNIVNTALLDWGEAPFYRMVRAVVDRGLA